MPLFSKASHAYSINDITIRECSENTCKVAADVVAVNKANTSTQERWLIYVTVVQGQTGQWLISRISGVDLYKQIFDFVKTYVSALERGDREGVISHWVSAPEGIVRFVNSDFAYNATTEIVKADQLNTELNLELVARKKTGSREIYRFSGVASAVNDQGRWKFTAISLNRQTVLAE